VYWWILSDISDRDELQFVELAWPPEVPPLSPPALIVLLFVLPDFSESLVDKIENQFNHCQKVARITAVDSIFGSRHGRLVEVVASTVWVIVPIPPAHPRLPVPLFPIGDVKHTVQVGPKFETD
jgi:hypothetical protein